MWWSCFGGTEAYLSGQLALTLLVASSDLQKSSPEMTYKVSSGTLSLYVLRIRPETAKHLWVGSVSNIPFLGLGI